MLALKKNEQQNKSLADGKLLISFVAILHTVLDRIWYFPRENLLMGSEECEEANETGSSPNLLSVSSDLLLRHQFPVSVKVTVGIHSRDRF